MKTTRFAQESAAQAQAEAQEKKRKLIGQTELMDAINRFGVRVVLEMMAECCYAKASEHERSVLPSFSTANRWRKAGKRLDQIAERINDA